MGVVKYVNRILTDEDREIYKPLIEKMFEKCPDMMGRKIAEANVQQAFAVELIEDIIRDGDRLLCVGSFEDTCNEYLKECGNPILEIDPEINYDLKGFCKVNKEKFDIVFSVSVIEHEPDDEGFIRDICNLLDTGGWGIITCDFKDSYKVGDPLPYSDVRFFTKNDLTVRLKKIVEDNGCEMVSYQDYDYEPDFVYQGHHYSFATFVFRKKQ